MTERVNMATRNTVRRVIFILNGSSSPASGPLSNVLQKLSYVRA